MCGGLSRDSHGQVFDSFVNQLIFPTLTSWWVFDFVTSDPPAGTSYPTDLSSTMPQELTSENGHSARKTVLVLAFLRLPRPMLPS
jgi:hypothetical protein